MSRSAAEIAEELKKQKTVMVYKDTKDSKLGITFFRRDPQEGGHEASAIISRIGATGPAAGVLEVGERIMSVQGAEVTGPLFAARMLRESEGYVKIVKLPKRDDFDENLEEYQAKEAQLARDAMVAANQIGQQPQSTPRTDAATPRGPGGGAMAAAAATYGSGLRPLNQPPGINVGSIQPDANPLAQLSARASQGLNDLGNTWGNLSARWTKGIQNIAEHIPTQSNKEMRAARTIQKAWRATAARGHFHEERGAVLMLQSAARRKKAQAVVRYKQTLREWAAIVIQESYRKHKHKQAKQSKAAAANSTPRKAGIGTKLIKSLSFSRRSAKKGPNLKPAMPDDITPDDLISARGTGPATPAVTSGSEPSPTTPEPTGAAKPKTRTLSFTRRKKAAAPAAEEVGQKQTV